MNLTTLTAGLDLLLLGFVLKRRRTWIGWRFPLLPGLLLAHLLLFGLPAMLFHQALGELVDRAALNRAAMVVTLGLLALVAGYELPLGPMLGAPIPRLTISWAANPIRPAFILLVLGAVALTAQKSGQPPIVDGLLTVTVFVGLWALAALWLLCWRGQLHSRAARLGLLILTLGIYALELSQGYLENPLIDSAMLYAVYLRAKGRIPWRAIILAAPLLLVLITAKEVFRAALPGGQWQSASLSEKASLYAASLRVAWEQPAAQEVGQKLMLRLSDIGLLAVVLEKTPAFVPYWGGVTYADLAWKLVPRLLAPAKPQEHTGSAFGHRYAILAADDEQTSVNLPFLIELYANFGLPAVAVGMLLAGLGCRVLEEIFAAALVSDAAFAVAAPVMASLFMIEDSAANAVGALLQHTPILLLVLELSGICRIRLGGPLGRPRRSGMPPTLGVTALDRPEAGP